MGRESTKPKTIYAIRNDITGRIYVGSTNYLAGRMKAHFKELEAGRKKWTLWQKDYNSYGKDSFCVYILEENVPVEEAPAREQYWIDHYQARDKNYGYNIREPVTKPLEIRMGQGLPPLPESK